ncbi:baseplate assembly protein [Pseudomonas phage PhiPA3]|uniref:Uncharacterized protein 189 n=1 Tax=Pseudomonas phage PhiPA3 TaxID=998086 RepID=F8SK58_BPPA3|nr:baseplate assembly protein [Pseudomonas phage PhiPA3]AEH03612.1 hypothetical protein [Pseudomonas phage PhiPA3]
MEASSFKLVSLGRVAENKARASRHVACVAVELATATDGEVTNNPQQKTIQALDSSGNTFEVKITNNRTFNCEWLPSEDNRATPPDVVRGELVEIWRMANTTQYFWRCLGLRNNLRQLESVVYVYNAAPKAGGAGIDFTTCYFMQWSPMDGHVTMGTSKANGEPFAFTMQFNTKYGSWYCMDDVGDMFELDAKERRLQMINADQSYVKVEKQSIEIKADQSVKIVCGGSTTEWTPSAITSTTGNWDVTAGATKYTTGGFDII